MERTYQITEDPLFLEEENANSAELKKQLEKCYKIATGGQRSGEKKNTATNRKFS